jgi:hypothetical protein
MTKRLMATCGLLLAFAVAALASKKTVITLNEPVIAGVKTVTLQPGTYVLRLMNHASNRNILEIFNEREDHLFALVLAVPNYRLEPKDKTDLRFWETPEGNPIALRAWFFPGDNWGQEIVYPKRLAAEIARQTGAPVLAPPPVETEAELTEAPVTEINKTGEGQPVEYDRITLDEMAEAPPATASPSFLLALDGMLSTMAGLGLKSRGARLR